jgi:hypothetical protein
MPFLRYKPKNMGDVQLYLGINDDVAVEFAEGATLPGIRTVADLRLLPTWLRGMRLLVDRAPPGLVRVEPIWRRP